MSLALSPKYWISLIEGKKSSLPTYTKRVYWKIFKRMFYMGDLTSCESIRTMLYYVDVCIIESHRNQVIHWHLSTLWIMAITTMLDSWTPCQFLAVLVIMYLEKLTSIYYHIGFKGIIIVIRLETCFVLLVCNHLDPNLGGEELKQVCHMSF